jgi:hypothetical protein
MMFEKSYRSYEEFQREEIRPLEKMEVQVDDLLSEFDSDRRQARREARKEGLFDAYADDSDDYEYDD